MLICYESTGGLFRNLEGMVEYKLAYPTVLKCVDKLLRLNMVSKEMDDKTAILRLVPPFDLYAEHLQGYQGMLMPSGAPTSKANMNELHKEIVGLILYYGQVIGVEPEQLVAWKRMNIPKLYSAARQIMKYTANEEVARQAIDKAKKFYESQDLSWSLQGAVLNNLPIFVRRSEPEKGAYKLDSPEKRLICSYKMLKGMAYDETAWDERHLKKAMPHAAFLVKIFGDWEKAAAYLEEESTYMKKKGLSFHIGTLADRVHDWMMRKREGIKRD